MLDASDTFTRQFRRPPCHSERVMKAELEELPGTWRIYGTDIFPSGRTYYVEFRVPAGQAKAAVLEALEKIESGCLTTFREHSSIVVEGSDNHVQDQVAPPGPL